MKALMIATSLAALTMGTAAYAASGSAGSDNPQASPNSGYTGMPGSSATSGGSMANPGGAPNAYAPQGPASTSTSRVAPQSNSSYGSSGYAPTTPPAGTGAIAPEDNPGAKYRPGSHGG